MASETHVEPEHETQQARALRGARQRAVTPGGPLDKIIGVLLRVLPMAIGILVAVMIITPLSPRGEVSFLLDRNKVGVIGERARVDNALYRGEDDKGRPFSIKAGEAVQKSSRNKVVRLSDMDVRAIFDEGPTHIQSSDANYYFSGDPYVQMFGVSANIVTRDGPSILTTDEANYFLKKNVLRVPGEFKLRTGDGYDVIANNAAFFVDTKRLSVPGSIRVRTADGYDVSANNAHYLVDQKRLSVLGAARLRRSDGYDITANGGNANVGGRSLSGGGGVSGQFPGGTFKADNIELDLPERSLILSGHARMRIYPGRLKAM